MDGDQGGGRPIRVVVVDRPGSRAGLCAMVEDADDLELVGEASDGAEALTQCRARPPDVVLVDLRMPGASGIAATVVLSTELPNLRVLMVTQPEDDTPLVAARRAGARGHVVEGDTPEEVLRAIRTVALAGEPRG